MNIGDKVRDIVSGFTGTITGITEWKGGRRQMHVTPSWASGPYVDGAWFDEARLELDTTPDMTYFSGRFTPPIIDS